MAIRETVGSDDNELYGEFFTGTVAMPVPEPGSWPLSAAGRLALVAFERRRPAGRTQPRSSGGTNDIEHISGFAGDSAPVGRFLAGGGNGGSDGIACTGRR